MSPKPDGETPVAPPDRTTVPQEVAGRTLPVERDSASATDVPGRVGDYEIVDELGRGGMGVVYKATQLSLDRPVAIKMILAGSLAGPEDLQRFKTEVEATAALRHPHIVQVHEFGEFEGRPFFCMEYVDGESLSDRLVEGPLSGRLAATYLVKIGRAIQHAHEHEILHRDLKPSNILVDARDEPSVTDFGLAKRMDHETVQTQSGAILGTPGYMAPEQAGGTGGLSPATDVYGLGALLYALLTGRPPFRAETPFETVRQVLENEPAPPRILNANVDRALETICLKCLEKDPARRYQSAAALTADLESYLAGEPISARSTNIVYRISAALDRSQYDVHFDDYGNMLFGLAGLVLLTEIAVTCAIEYRLPAYVLPAIHYVRVVVLAVMFWYGRRGELLPRNHAERIMWSLWGGYVITCVLYGVTYRLVNDFEPALEPNLYPFLAAVTGMAFVVLGSSYWGWCYAIGFAFFALSLVMTVNLRWAMIEFGVLWAIALTTIGVRLHRLAAKTSPRDASRTSQPTVSSVRRADP